MVRNEEKYQLATDYRKRGFSYSEIAQIVGVSKSTVSAWLSKKSFSKKVAVDNTRRAAAANSKRIAMLNKARTHTKRAAKQALEQTAAAEYALYSASPRFLAGLATYAALGDMASPGTLRITTTRTTPAALWLRFVRQYLALGEAAATVSLLYPPKQGEAVCVAFWGRALKVKQSQWRKHHAVSSLAADGFGSATIRVHNTAAKTRLLTWIGLFEADMRRKK